MQTQTADSADAIRVGIVDSGCSERHWAQVSAATAFIVENDSLWQCDAIPDQLSHGSASVEVVCAEVPQAALYIAQVFQARLTTTAVQVAAAIDWLCSQQVQLINLSLGLRRDDPALREAVAAAVAQGVLLCASTPARGEPVWPASYPGVLRVTGDARCQPGEWALLAGQRADIGACVQGLSDAGSGASIATARVTATLARFMTAQPGISRARLGQQLKQQARYMGAEGPGLNGSV
ncbi:MAG: S8 family serine peptidase [Marinobacterium sp.]|nr:S8 family serine peptidase [Marinobacterium sp.]